MAIEILRPNGAGANSYCTPVGEASNYLCVDEAVNDGDGTYVYSTTVIGSGGQRDSYALQNHAQGSGSIASVTVKASCRSTLWSTSANMQPMIRVTGVDYNLTDWQQITDSYAQYAGSAATNPGTGQPWTWSEIDALEAGVKLAAPAGYESRCTQVWVEVNYTLPGRAFRALLGVGR